MGLPLVDLYVCYCTNYELLPLYFSDHLQRGLCQVSPRSEKNERAEL